MILHPQNSPETDTGADAIPVWQAVERRQKQPASEWLLVAQPDHAALAGDLAARISSPLIPAVDDEVIAGIALHDEGWAPFDSEPRLNAEARPVSFLELPPSEFVPAWLGSIERAQQVAPIAGILVSGHFCRLGHGRLHAGIDTPSDEQILRAFLTGEDERQRRLESMQSRSADEIRVSVDLLQFCDVLSLYLCCGSRASVEFPQKLRGESLSLERRGEMCVMKPHLFGDGISLAVRARRYPAGDAVTIPVLLG